MRAPTLRIPVFKQPPVYLVAAVVLVSLLPLLLRLGGIDLDATTRPTSSAIVRAVEARFQAVVPRGDMLAAAASLPNHEASALLPAGLLETYVGGEASADEDLDIVILESDEGEEGTRHCPVLVAEPTLAPAGGPEAARREREPKTPRPSWLATAKAACKRGHKDTARSAYRKIPLGDSRRREVRRACREDGVWLL